MVWFSEIQKVFNPFGSSFITAHGCILRILKLKCFTPLLNGFFFSFLLLLLPEAETCTCERLAATLHSFSLQICTHTYLWGFNHWHLMHRHISTHILENQPCWLSFAQRTGLEATHRLTKFLLQKRYICIFGSWSSSTWFNTVQSFPVSLLGQWLPSGVNAVKNNVVD